ncbi:hypothetical protein [Halocalculus aciditolerans]|uniref:hypothetical protein n=1 Tax=Halocalculus aciditolerans TaxID=1383812 RepID=UPI00166E73B3|nr:hypothetical protein [Halocalculus aciditolerans]
MRLRDDTRGVTVQVGAILLFAVLVVLLSIYQAQVVPTQNEGTEFQHSQAVQSDMVELRNNLLKTAASGNSYPTAVDLGARYQPRIFFVNPPPVTGQLRTGAAGNVTITGATATESDAADYWNGNERNFTTKPLVYRASYTYIDSPDVRYSNSLVYRNYTQQNAQIVDADPSIVDGNRLTFVTLTGNYSQSGVRTSTLDFQTKSTAMKSTQVTADSEMTIRLPSSLSADRWESLLGDDYDPDGADGATDDADGHVVDVTEDGSRIALTLEPGTYTLQMANVGVGTGADDPRPWYVVKQSGNGSTVAEDGTQTLVAEVRDKYNNPYSGQTVHAEIVTAKGSGESVTPTDESGVDGDASFTYNAPDSITGQEKKVNVSVWFGSDTLSGEPRQKAFYDLTVRKGGTSGGDGGGGGSTSASQIDYNYDASPYNGESGIQFSITNTGNDSVEVTDVMVNSSAADTIYESSGGNNHEIMVGSGYYDSGDQAKGRDAYRLETKAPLIRPATVAPGADSSVKLYYFYDGGRETNMQYESVTVHLYFDDGSEKTIQFTNGGY